MAETSACRVLACGTVVDGRVARCPRCGSVMLTSRRLRVLGWVMFSCGVFLVALIAGIPSLTRMFLGPTVDFSLPESSSEAILLLAPVALVGGFGLAATVLGGWQAATGKRSRHGPLVLVGIIMLTMVACWLASVLLGGDVQAPRPIPLQ